MRSSRLLMRCPRATSMLSLAFSGVTVAGLFATGARAQEALATQDGPNAQPPVQEPAPIVRQPPAQEPGQPQQAHGQDAGYQSPGSNFDATLFQRPIPKEQLAFLSQFAGMPSNQLYRDKQFRKLMHSFVPDCTFHYGSDKSLTSALDEVIEGSSEPVQVRDGRYVLLSGHMGQYLAGKGFLWIDMQDGIGLGGFYFHPTNGEPTPAVNIFSRQVQKR